MAAIWRLCESSTRNTRLNPLFLATCRQSPAGSPGPGSCSARSSHPWRSSRRNQTFSRYRQLSYRTCLGIHSCEPLTEIVSCHSSDFFFHLSYSILLYDDYYLDHIWFSFSNKCTFLYYLHVVFPIVYMYLVIKLRYIFSVINSIDRGCQEDHPQLQQDGCSVDGIWDVVSPGLVPGCRDSSLRLKCVAARQTSRNREAVR